MTEQTRRSTLKAEIYRRGMSQRLVAFRAGIPENRLSKIVCGWLEPSASEREALERVLSTGLEEELR